MEPQSWETSVKAVLFLYVLYVYCLAWDEILEEILFLSWSTKTLHFESQINYTALSAENAIE